MMLSGRGDVQIGGKTAGSVEYKLTISKTGNVYRADGHAWGDPEVIVSAWEADDVYLVRADNGYAMKIHVSSYTPGESAVIVVDGSPGPI